MRFWIIILFCDWLVLELYFSFLSLPISIDFCWLLLVKWPGGFLLVCLVLCLVCFLDLLVVYIIYNVYFTFILIMLYYYLLLD